MSNKECRELLSIHNERFVINFLEDTNKQDFDAKLDQ